MLFAGNYSQNVKGYPLADAVMKILDESFEIIKLDYVPHDDIIYYMNSSEVLLMTSYSEGSPVIIKEALACGFTSCINRCRRCKKNNKIIFKLFCC